MEKKCCAKCEEPIDEGEEYEYKGEYYCQCCVDSCFVKCVMCGTDILADESHFWGDARICDGCLEEECPSFDPKENEEETTDAYYAFKERYIGKRMCGYDGEVDVEWDVGVIRYRMTVTTDQDGYITDISRMTGEMLLAEDVRSSEWRPYPIYDDDYESLASDELEEWLDYNDDDEDFDEDMDIDESDE